jgi:hypothetical protein
MAVLITITETISSAKSFPKKFNLNRHLRQIHDQKPATKIRQSG